jgi:hypothetical protein
MQGLLPSFDKHLMFLVGELLDHLEQRTLGGDLADLYE